MHILFVEDNPQFKLQSVLDFLKSNSINFSYSIQKNSADARRYIYDHLNEINLAVIDLGLPVLDDGFGYDDLEGLFVVDEILRRNINIPVIINSTTPIPDEEEYLEQYTNQNAKIVHVESLGLDWFIKVLKSFI